MAFRKPYGLNLLLAAALLCPASLLAQSRQNTSSSGDAAFQQVVDRIAAREQENQKALQRYEPIAETYVQRLRPDHELGFVPISDDYFVGRVSFNRGAHTRTMLDRRQWWKRIFGEPNGRFHADGFAQMVELDPTGFDRNHYDFDYVGREFLGSLRCIVLDVRPKPHSGDGRFIGRIWAEDQGYNIVRFNGTYVSHRHNRRYTHFDTWRLNMQPGLWLPAYVYSQETGMNNGLGQTLDYRSQTRLWAYNVGRMSLRNSFTDVEVDSGDSVQDQSANVQDLSPVASQRAWQRQAEDNVLDRLQRAGLLAPAGEVDKVLDTVVNNLIITNKLDIEPEVRTRVLLTAPIESFTVGHTIILSRGLIDTLPDEASLAAVLAHELAHIKLDHGMDTDYAFSDKTFFPDEATLHKLNFSHNVTDEDEADRTALHLLENSPYQSRLTSAGLFLRQLQASRNHLPHLVRAHLGDALTFKKDIRLPELRDQAPVLQPDKLDQIAALPLGGRVKLDPWSDRLEMSHAKKVALESPKEKLPLEVTPFFPYEARFGDAEKSTDANAQNTAPATPPNGAAGVTGTAESAASNTTADSNAATDPVKPEPAATAAPPTAPQPRKP